MVSKVAIKRWFAFELNRQNLRFAFYGGSPGVVCWMLAPAFAGNVTCLLFICLLHPPLLSLLLKTDGKLIQSCYLIHCFFFFFRILSEMSSRIDMSLSPDKNRSLTCWRDFRQPTAQTFSKKSFGISSFDSLCVSFTVSKWVSSCKFVCESFCYSTCRSHCHSSCDWLWVFLQFNFCVGSYWGFRGCKLNFSRCFYFSEKKTNSSCHFAFLIVFNSQQIAYFFSHFSPGILSFQSR